jgi:tetratricopeptide (TPR) repeat protein
VDRKSLDDLAIEFQIGLFETALSLGRDDLSLVAELAELYTRSGRYRDGLALDERLVGREPANPIFRYNLACSLALVGDVDRAFEELERALGLGFKDVKLMLEDRDLDRLRADPRWARFEERLSED